MTCEIAVLGGAGRVGLSMAALLAKAHNVVIIDMNEAAVRQILQGCAPFKEPSLGALLSDGLKRGAITATSNASVINNVQAIVVAVGRFADPPAVLEQDPAYQSVLGIREHLRSGQLLILRSTVYPGVCRRLEDHLNAADLRVDIAVCPERTAEGAVISELTKLPQLVGARSNRTFDHVRPILETLTNDLVAVTPEEAELAKLIANAWRYIQFAAANEFYMLSRKYGVDYEDLRAAVGYRYPRCDGLARSGLAAGPCLPKDTGMLVSAADGKAVVSSSALTVNERLPGFLVDEVRGNYAIEQMTVGILGMSFKPDVDDNRNSHANVLRTRLGEYAKRVVCTDPYIADDATLQPIEAVLQVADLLVVGAPHSVYRNLQVRQPIVDVWGIVGRSRHRPAVNLLQ